MESVTSRVSVRIPSLSKIPILPLLSLTVQSGELSSDTATLSLERSVSMVRQLFCDIKLQHSVQRQIVAVANITGKTTRFFTVFLKILFTLILLLRTFVRNFNAIIPILSAMYSLISRFEIT